MVLQFDNQPERLKKKLTTGQDGDHTPIKQVYHYLFNILVFQFRVCSIEYFLDRMTEWEVNDIVDNIPYLDRTGWEQSRLCAWVTAQVNSKDTISFQDLAQFKWEEKETVAKNTEITDEEISRLKRKADEISNENKLRRTGALQEG